MLLDQGMGALIGGDARVTTAPGGHFATSHNAVNISDKERADTSLGGGGGGIKKRSGGGGGGKNSGGDKPATPPPATFTRPSQPITKTKKTGQTLCLPYNTGACTNGCHGGVCPADGKSRHICHWCTGNHPATKCGEKTPTKKSNRGKGGDSGKGGKGKSGKGW